MNESHTPEPEKREYDLAVEALRRALNELPRFSFLLDQQGNVRRVADRYGRWIDWQSAHELFDPVVIDALVAKHISNAAIAKATGGEAA